MRKFAYFLFVFICFIMPFQSDGREKEVIDITTTNQIVNNMEYDLATTPTPLLIATGMGPTPTPTPVPTHSPFSQCMHDCVVASYPPSSFPLFDPCFTKAVQGGTLIACGLGCLPTGPAWPGCVGGCYAISLAVCMGIPVFDMVVVLTTCAWECW